jgi:ubiquitin-conjugating enzyme E2 S
VVRNPGIFFDGLVHETTSYLSPSLHLHSSQTIKCLLIYPNPESALNEEAGRLLLEHYEDYSSRARMMTAIHAKPSRGGGEAGASGSDVGKKRPLDSGSTSGLEKKKKDKKKALKRL